MIQFINSLGGLLAGIGSFLGAVVALGKLLINSREEHSRQKIMQVEPPGGEPSTRRRSTAITCILITVLLLLLALAIFAGRTVPGIFGSQIGRQGILIKAFLALEDERWETAVQKAEKVLAEFAGNAAIEQEKLENAHAPLPPTGKAPATQREEIYARGLLNDVAASYFITGRALEHLGRIGEAKRAYEEAAKLSYGRTYDPKEDSFWSPAEAALGRLRTLPVERTK
jgi:tetratricopeptide (TPR) repeat protein